MAERELKAKCLRSGGGPAWEKRSRSTVTLASSALAAETWPRTMPGGLRALPFPALHPLGAPIGSLGLTWPGMEKAQPQRFGEAGWGGGGGGTIKKTLAGPRLEIPAPRGKAVSAGVGLPRLPKFWGILGTFSPFTNLVIAIGSLGGKMHKFEFCPQIRGAQ